MAPENGKNRTPGRFSGRWIPDPRGVYASSRAMACVCVVIGNPQARFFGYSITLDCYSVTV